MRFVIAAVLAAALVAGCGDESAADKAKNQACDARADIGDQIDTLKGLSVSPDSVDQAQEAIGKIDDDLKQITEALPDVEGDLKDQLQTANASFADSVRQITSDITSAEDIPSALDSLGSAASSLESSYREAFGDVSC